MAKFLVINGPNLNMLGDREPAHYGASSLAEIDERLRNVAASSGHEVSTFQSNAEHELVERIQSAREQGIDAIVINPAAFTHTSVAIRDALSAVAIPFFEIHLSNIYARESFRQKSYFSDIAVGVISGVGAYGYELALQAAMRHVGAGSAE